MPTFDAYVQSMRKCPNRNCGKHFALYVDYLPSQDMTNPKTYWKCECPHCQMEAHFDDGAFTHLTNAERLPKGAVHAEIVEPEN